MPALDVPQDSRQGTAALFSIQLFICRQEGAFDLSDGKSCCLWTPLERHSFGGGSDKARGGFEGERGGSEGTAGVRGRAHPRQIAAYLNSTSITATSSGKGSVTHRQRYFVELQ